MKAYRIFIFLMWLEFKRILLGTKYFAEVDVTDNCNLRCKHCYHFKGKSKFIVKEISLDVWKERFEGLHKRGIRFVLMVGGEPSIRKDVLMLADEIFPYVYIITNGTIKVPDEFNRTLFVSLEGLEKTNDSIRGKGVFEKVIKNYSGDKRVVINMTVSRDNYKEVGDVVRLAKEKGFRGVVCNICASTKGANIPLVVKRDERKIITDELKRVKSLYPKDFLLSKSMIKWYEFPDHTDYCHWGDTALHFDVSWNKRRCFGISTDCSNCGCLAGSLQSPLRMLRHPREMIQLIRT